MEFVFGLILIFVVFVVYVLGCSAWEHKKYLKVKEEFNQGKITRQQAEDSVDFEHKHDFYLYKSYGLTRKVLLSDGKVHTLRESCVGGIYMYLNQEGYKVDEGDILMEK